MSHSPISVLVIEDDPDTRANLRDILELDNYRVEQAASVAETLDRADSEWSGFQAILLDRKLPDGTAADLLPRLRQLAPEAAVIVVTGHADVGGAIDAIRHRADDYLLKPIDPAQLRFRLGQIAEHRRLKEAHRESERFARSVLDSLSANIAVLDHSGVILAVNQAWRDFALENAPSPIVAEGSDYLETCARATGEDAALAQDLASGIKDVLAGRRELFELEYPCHSPDKRRWFICRVTPIDGEHSRRAVVAHVEITGRKHAEQRALLAERLAAIGQMVTGLAHESGNALQRSQSNLEMLDLLVGEIPRARDLIDKQQRALDDLARLYDEVRNYAAPIRLGLGDHDLRSIWRLTWADMERSWGCRKAVLVEEIAADDLICEVDPHRIGQVFRILLENALAACPDPVEITIQCTACDLMGHPAVRVSVRDNGPGFDPQQSGLVFEPFYTTKAKGTGLGLAIAQRIVEAHGGRIEVGDSSQGAEIVITLPRNVKT